MITHMVTIRILIRIPILLREGTVMADMEDTLVMIILNPPKGNAIVQMKVIWISCAVP